MEQSVRCSNNILNYSQLFFILFFSSKTILFKGNHNYLNLLFTCVHPLEKELNPGTVYTEILTTGKKRLLLLFSHVLVTEDARTGARDPHDG